jgi:hypothetical protein
MINDVDNEVQVSNKDLIIIYKCGFFKGPAYLFRQRTGLRRVIRGLFGIRVLFLDGIIGWIPGLFNPPPHPLCVQKDFTLTFQTNAKCNNVNHV